MHGRKLYHALGPYVAAVAAVATAAVLVFAIYFTRFDLEWGAFLTGILLAGILAMVDRTLRAEFLVASHAAKLVIAQYELARETHEYKVLDEAYASAKARLRLTDEALPVMLAYVDAERRCQYHNSAFATFVGLPPKKIDGRHLRDVLGRNFYAEIEDTVDEVLAGRTFYIERTRKMPDGAIYHLLTQYLPRFASEGNVAGFFTALTDITNLSHLASGAPDTVAEAIGPERGTLSAGADAASAQDMFSDSLAEQVTGWKDAADRIIASIEKDEFTLFCQLITPLALDSGQPGHYEILVRLLEEEENLLPPGAFFPLAEKHGLMPRLDRWVVAHVLQWASARKTGNASAAYGKCFINIAGATISDPDFPEFVLHQLQKFSVAGSTICFEMTVSDVTSRRGDAAEFARLVKQSGCQIALCDYGGDRLSLDILKNVPADFLKIDGSIILNILRDPVHLAKVVTISRMAKAIGIRTIGELVEDEETKARLREADIDFAQGYGISRPQPLADVGRMTG